MARSAATDGATTARLRIALVNGVPGGQRVAALADVIPADEGGTPRRDVPVPADAWVVVDVAPGRYAVRAVLASGEVLDEEVMVCEDETRDVELRAEIAPEHWLAMLTAVTRRALGPMTPDGEAPVRATLVVGGAAWPEVAPGGGAALPVVDTDDTLSTFEVTDAPWGQRAYAVARRRGRADVVVLPVPWGRAQPRTVQLVVPHDGAGPRLAVRDPDIGALLGYVGAGALDTAGRIIARLEALREDPVGVLVGEHQNPYGAVLAAYVLVTAGTADARWTAWAAKLTHGYPWIADGAVLAGALAARDGRRTDAARWYAEAVRRGVPALTGALRLLHAGLLTVPALATELATVTAALARADVTQPFVTLRFDADAV